MDFLKWIFTTSMALALMFFGMAPESDKEEASLNSGNATTVHVLLR